VDVAIGRIAGLRGVASGRIEVRPNPVIPLLTRMGFIARRRLMPISREAPQLPRSRVCPTSPRILRARGNRVPFEGAARRLVEPRQRQRRAQFETARTLLLRDRDSGQKRFLGSRRVGRVTLRQHLAADAMQLGVELAISDVLARRKRFVEDGEGAINVAGPGLGLGKRNFALVLA
jgi:hypothetical protein